MAAGSTWRLEVEGAVGGQPGTVLVEAIEACIQQRPHHLPPPTPPPWAQPQHWQQGGPARRPSTEAQRT